jgi:hypothetical protein
MPTYTNPVAVTTPVYTPEGKECAVAWQTMGLATGELTLNAVHPLIYLPRGAVVHDMILITTDMDTSTGLVISVGVAGDTERYIRRLSGQTAGSARIANDATSAATVIAARAALTGDTVVNLLIQAAATTPAAGTVTIGIFYTCE